MKRAHFVTVQKDRTMPVTEKAKDWLEAHPKALALATPSLIRRFSAALDGFKRAWPTLVGSSVKTEKGEKKGILTGILYLAPFDEAGIQVCAFASSGCAAACLGHSSGQMVFDSSKEARILRTWLFFADRALFSIMLNRGLLALARKAEREGMKAFFRPNGTSDLPFETLLPSLFTFCAEYGIQLYDYTKSKARALAFAAGKLPEGYHVTFSRSEENESDAIDVLNAGGNVAVVFSVNSTEDQALPAYWKTYEVTDGDETDARPTDARGIVVGLKAKGSLAKRDTTGFVVHS